MENVAEKSPLAVVAIDGVVIKNLRETNKLTQLYVASVVGVTTDTISRWENNRYPTIKRDNAEKLASALEVELAEILRREESEEIAGETPAPPPPKGRRSLLIPALVTVLLLMAAFFSWRLLATPAATRKLPRYGAPGAILPVQIKINRKDSSSVGLIVKERLPGGWRLVGSSPPAAAGPVDAGEIKWLIPAAGGPVTVNYTVQVPAGAALKTTADFTGELVSNAGGVMRRGALGGERNVTVAAIHWADGNGDGRIDDDEIMPAYYLLEEMKGVTLDWQTIEAIWSGKGYRWEPQRREFSVIRQDSAAPPPAGGRQRF